MFNIVRCEILHLHRHVKVVNPFQKLLASVSSCRLKNLRIQFKYETHYNECNYRYWIYRY